MWPPLQSAFSFSFRCIVFLLNAAVFADLALYLAVSFSRSLTTFSLKLAGSRSATLNLATALLSARSRASVCSGPCCESSSGHPCLPLHLCRHCSFLRDLDLFLKLFVITSTRSFQCVLIVTWTWDISLVELERRISMAFLTVITRSLCN